MRLILFQLSAFQLFSFFLRNGDCASPEKVGVASASASNGVGQCAGTAIGFKHIELPGLDRHCPLQAPGACGALGGNEEISRIRIRSAEIKTTIVPVLSNRPRSRRRAIVAEPARKCLHAIQAGHRPIKTGAAADDAPTGGNARNHHIDRAGWTRESRRGSRMSRRRRRRWTGLRGGGGGRRRRRGRRRRGSRRLGR